MLNSKDLLEKMKKHFPRWMEIRRRVSKTNGGKYLESIAETIAEINNAIEDYKKDFFIDSYFNKEDDIIAFLYRINVGNVDINSIKLIEPNLILTEDQKMFYTNNNYAYYEDGHIYIKEEYLQIKYKINNQQATINTEKVHVWNIFDEFAIFLGLKRYKFETNKQLLERILALSSNRPNSSENGLKNAIIANLKGLGVSLDKEEILIESPTPENLNKYYNDFETVLDYLEEINRDVYKSKKWDIDAWNFNFKHIDYIPHAWDIVLQEYTNGIGFNDDLKVHLFNNDNNYTDLDIFFYKKSLETITSYIKSNNIQKEIKLDLIKYNDNFESKNVKYKITASKAYEINPKEIEFSSYFNDYENKKVYIKDLCNPQTCNFKNIEVVKPILNKGSSYNIEVKHIESYGDFIINKINTINEYGRATNKIDYLINDFERVGDSIKSSLSKKYLNQLYNFQEVRNAKQSKDGITIDNLSQETYLKTNIDGCPKIPISYEIMCQPANVLRHEIKLSNCYYIGNNIVADDVIEEKSIEINMDCNFFSAKITGKYKIECFINNQQHELAGEINDGFFLFKTRQFNSPVKMKIKIILEKENNIFSSAYDLVYSKYDFNITTTAGDLLTIAEKQYTPNTSTNNLIVTFKTYTSNAPTIKYIYIGQDIKNHKYTLSLPTISEYNTEIDIDAPGCEIILTEIKNDTIISTTYNPTISYKALSNDSFIELDLTHYKKIDDFILNNDCSINSLQNGIVKKHILKIPNNREVSYINIVGEIEKLKVKKDLYTILSKHIDMINSKIYISYIEDNLIIKNMENIEYRKINKYDIDNYYFSTLKISTNDKNIKPIIIKNNNKSISYYYDYDFDNILFAPIENDVCIAINERNIVDPIERDIKIINTFNNNYSNSKLYFYSIESLDESSNVYFNIGITKSSKSLDKAPISIDTDIDSLNIKYENITIKNTVNIGNSIDLRNFEILNRINLSNYIILKKQYEIIYTNKYIDIENENDYVFLENILIKDVLFNKLYNCNIYEIEEVKLDNEIIDSSNYKIIKDAGIIIWQNPNLIGRNVRIKYNTQKATHLKLSIDDLYEKIENQIEAYDYKKYSLKEVKDNSLVNLNNYNEYNTNDFITVKSSNPLFSIIREGDYIRIKKEYNNDTLAVKSGYYYFNGNEYYMFANENKNIIEKIDNIELYNVRNDKFLFLEKTTSNYIYNSSMQKLSKSEVFTLDCQDEELDSVSILNSLTTCSTYNHWTNFNMNIKIIKSFNEEALMFEKTKEVGYSYFKLPNLNNDIFVLSCYASVTNNNAIFLAKSKNISKDFNGTPVIEPIAALKPSIVNDNILQIEFNKINNEDSYYLLILDSCVIDDLILQEKSKYNISYHNKNIDILNLNVQENLYPLYTTRLYLDDNIGSVNNGTEVKDGYIFNSSLIEWGYSKIHQINTNESFRKCILNNVNINHSNENYYIETLSNNGSITSYPIFLGNTKTIKSLCIKINDILLDKFKDFEVKIDTSSLPNINYKECIKFKNNMAIIDGELLSNYIKINVNIPANRVINNIEVFILYKTNDNNAPTNKPIYNGEYITRLLNTNHISRYKIKSLKIESKDCENKKIFIRGAKMKNKDIVFSDWKEILLNDNHEPISEIVFDQYQYFQIKTILYGINAAIKLSHIDLEVI